MRTRGKYVIIGIACIAVVLPVLYLSFANQSTLETEIIPESPKSISFDEKIRSINTDNSFANKILSDCGADEQCVVEALRDLSSVEEEKAVLETLNVITSAYDSSGFYCHGAAHHLGMFLYGLTGNLTQTLEFAEKRDCGGAMYHGALENYFLSEMILNDGQVEKIEFVNICKDLADDAKKMKRIECAHGVGHGLTKVYDYDVFSSVKQCDKFPDATENRVCYEGVFMENVGANLKTDGGTFDENDIFFPCNKLDEKYSGACYYYHVTYMLKQNRNLDKTFDDCNSVTPRSSLIFCYMGIGRQYTTTFLNNLEGMIPLCQKGLDKYQRYCYQGALILIADQQGFDESFEACRVFPELFKMDCYTLLGDWIRIESTNQGAREKQCASAENEKYFQVCITAQI